MSVRVVRHPDRNNRFWLATLSTRPMATPPRPADGRRRLRISFDGTRRRSGRVATVAPISIPPVSDPNTEDPGPGIRCPSARWRRRSPACSGSTGRPGISSVPGTCRLDPISETPSRDLHHGHKTHVTSITANTFVGFERTKKKKISILFPRQFLSKPSPTPPSVIIRRKNKS